MQIAMRQWAKERSEKGLTIISHRIGIHFGSCIVGNVGNDELKEFTVIGDVVNVANRVCDAGKELKSDFVITEELRLRLNEEIKAGFNIAMMVPLSITTIRRPNQSFLRSEDIVILMTLLRFLK